VRVHRRTPGEVWAPRAHSVILVRQRDGVEERVPLDPAADGWWAGGELKVGDDYGFLVDEAGPFPDPRSPSQPLGVHAPSRHVDPAAWTWTDGAWRGVEPLGALQYELHVGAFTLEGTLDAAIAELDRLAAAGIELVMLMPVAPFPGERGWGYDGVGMYAVHEAYGGPEALQRFVDAAHARGLGVGLDVVFNHQGPEGNYLGMYGPYFTDTHDTPWGHGANLDGPGSEHVRAHIIGAALRWFEDFHIDALRLDAVHALVDDSPRHLLAELADEVAELAVSLGRPLALIAESDLNNPRTVEPTDTGGLGQTMQWADDVHHAIHAYMTGERQAYYVDFGSVETLDHALRHVFVHDGRMSTFRGKPWGSPVPADTDRRRFVVFASNHDQVGNRALGDRPIASTGPAAAAASLALVLLGPFTPMLFMGEEYGEDAPFQYFTDFEGELGTAVTEGRLREFASHDWGSNARDTPVPDPQSPLTFAQSKLIHAHDPALAYAAMREWVATCNSLRSRVRDQQAWERRPIGAREIAPRVLVMDGPVTVIANLSASPIVFQQEPGTGLVGRFAEVTEGEDALDIGPASVALVA
jgi:maltooligosyltrehalose trehalohydrolase